MNIKIISKGNRETIRLIRSYLLIAFSMLLLLLFASAWFEWDWIFISLVYGMGGLAIITVVLSACLVIHKRVGSLELDNSNVIVNVRGAEYRGKISIILNADANELKDAKHNPVAIWSMPKHGHFLVIENHPEFDSFELVFRRRQRKELIHLQNPDVIITERFLSRPLVHQSPMGLIYSIAGILE